ncbi:ABC transporter permease [Geothrix sp. 21YS21S-4]|uniref:ABC transporter permease n=1 Tax=Geothrix sp. 21YS21S-4 TaxID=3068889 RepID=UPI0027B95394|nr:ABC transporter permease [Geothrix sp. 21YS21S-4]
MKAFPRLLAAEALKLRRSPLRRLTWLLPLLFIAVEFIVFERSLLRVKELSPRLQALAESLPPKMTVAIWGGFLQPVALALIPAQLFRPEHRYKTWRHLHAQPVSRRGLFLAKAVWAFLLNGVMLIVVGGLLWGERSVLGWLNPALAVAFPTQQVVKILGWMWIGSMPVLAIYLWISDRISSAAVPLIFGVVGLLLTMALTGQELAQPWRRDLIPWVLPYASAEQVIRSGPIQQEAHVGGAPFQAEPNVLRLPSGRKIRTWQNIPDEQLFPPPPPTPPWLLAFFSVGAGLSLLCLAWWDAGRSRV